MFNNLPPCASTTVPTNAYAAMDLATAHQMMRAITMTARNHRAVIGLSAVENVDHRGWSIEVKRRGHRPFYLYNPEEAGRFMSELVYG